MSTRRTLRDLADLTERLHTMATDVWQALPEAERSWALGAARRHLRSACEALDIAARQVPDDFVIVSGPERAHVDELLEIAAEAREDRRRQEAAEEADWAGVARAFEPEVEEARHG